MLTAIEIMEVLQAGHELRGFEVKGPGDRNDPHLFAKVTRAALSMANHRDGGHIIIGIDDKRTVAMLPGLTDPQLASWLAYDDVSRKLAEYADPPLRFEVASRELVTKVTVAVLQIFQFDDIPVLCGKDFPGVLRQGACYVRSHRVPESAEIPTAAEMRELLDLASERRLRAYVSTAERAGVELRGGPTAAERFDAQLPADW